MVSVYDALKSGTSIEELTNLFEKSVKEAQDKIKQEELEKAKEKANAAAIIKARKELIDSIIKYSKVLGEDDEKEDDKEWEKEFIKEANEKLKEIEDAAKMDGFFKDYFYRDDDIISRFIKGIF